MNMQPWALLGTRCDVIGELGIELRANEHLLGRQAGRQADGNAGMFFTRMFSPQKRKFVDMILKIPTSNINSCFLLR